MRIGSLLGMSCLLLFGALPAQAADDPRYRVETVAEGLDFPWSVAFLPDGRALVTERVGHLRMIANGKLLDAKIEGVPKPYVESQAGLFDVVLDPHFAGNGQIYLSFAQGRGRANRTRVVSAHLDAMQLTNVKPIFTASPTKATPVHFGGRMAFIADGTLVIGLGDGFDYREKAQRLDSHLGKLVRINTDGSVPADNPFVGKDGAIAMCRACYSMPSITSSMNTNTARAAATSSTSSSRARTTAGRSRPSASTTRAR